MNMADTRIMPPLRLRGTITRVTAMKSMAGSVLAHSADRDGCLASSIRPPAPISELTLTAVQQNGIACKFLNKHQALLTGNAGLISPRNTTSEQLRQLDPSAAASSCPLVLRAGSCVAQRELAFGINVFEQEWVCR